MTAMMGVALTLVGACTSLTSVLTSVVPLIVALLIVLGVELALGGAAFREFRRVNRKVAALRYGRRSGAPRETRSPGGGEAGPEAPRS
jgi:hypothetical protein